MSSRISPLAGKLAPLSSLIDVAQLIHAYADHTPDPRVAAQRVSFGTSGHRGSAFDRAFNEWHVWAITQAICHYRESMGINGPLFLGIDTHALSRPACASALEVLAANGVEVMLASNDEYTPTPTISHAILAYNKGRSSGLADGIVVTPSHNPPRDGGIKYNPPNGGPAGRSITAAIEAAANRFFETQLDGVQRVSHATALRAATTHRHDFVNAYVADIGNVIDMIAIRDAKIRLGVDPLGGAGVHYWAVIAERYQLNLTVISETVDPTFAFMPLDWDGQIRMDPSSKFAMQWLINVKDEFDIAFACDTDHDRHGIVTRSAGLLPSNHYLAVAIDYLFQNRPQWGANAAIGKSVASTQMIDRFAAALGRKVYEVPVGFKWYVEGLLDGALAFAGEESAGATFLRRDGAVWTTDKDGIVSALLAAEITARMGADPAEGYRTLTHKFGECFSDRIEAPATATQKRVLAKQWLQQVIGKDLAGDAIINVLNDAPGNGVAIGGVKIVTEHGWFAARPSGTEDIYKIYIESFRGMEHLQRIANEAQAMIASALSADNSLVESTA